MRNLQEQVKKAFCYQKLFWPFTVWMNCYSDLKNFASSRPSASNFKWFSGSLEQFFHTVSWNNFGNKIPFLTSWLLSDFFEAVRILWLISLLIKPLFCCCDYVKKCIFFLCFCINDGVRVFFSNLLLIFSP